MEQLILRANFQHTEEDDLQQQFTQALSEWNSESVTFAQLQACFKASQTKICHPRFPVEGSSGYYMGYHLIRCLVSIADDLVGEGKAKAADINEMYLGFILQMVQLGPLSSHTEYIEMLMSDRDVEFEEFFRSLRGDRLKAIVRSLKKEYKPDAGMEHRSYFSNYLDCFWKVFVSSGLSEEQFKEMHPEFIELYLFFNMGFLDRDTEVRKAMHNLAYQIDLKYDRAIFEDIKDVSLLRHYFAEVGKIILAPGFPTCKESGKEVEDDLRRLLKVVSNEGLLSEMYDVIMDLALDLTIRKANCEGTRQHFDTIGYFFYHLKDDTVTGNKQLFEGLMPKYVHFLNHVRDEGYLTFKFVEPVMYDCLNKAMGTSDNHVRMWIDMIKALLKHSIPSCIDTAYRAIREQDKVLKWKKYPEDLKDIFSLLSLITFPKWLTEDQLKDGNSRLEQLTEMVLDEAKKVGIVKLGLTKPIVQFAFHCMEVGTEASYSLAEALVDRLEFNAKKDKALMMETIQKVTTYFEEDRNDWEDEEVRDLGFALRDLVTACIDAVKDGKLFTWEEYDELIYLVKLSEKRMQSMSEMSTSIFFSVFTVVCMNITTWLQTMNEEHRLIPLVPSIINLLDVEEEQVQTICSSQMILLSRTAGAMFARYNEKLVDKFLEDENHELLFTLANSYEFNTGPVEKHFDELFEHIDSGNMSVRSYILQLLAKVAKFQPHLFSQEKVEMVVKEAREDAAQQVQFLMVVGDIAKRNMDNVESSIDSFFNASLWQPMSAYSVITILQLYGLASEEKADRVITHLMKRIQTSSDNTEVLVALNACRLLGFKHRPAIEKHRSAIEQFRETTGDNNYHAGCTAILDMLDGKSVDKITDELRELQGDVADLEVRVTATENDIAEVKDTVQQQGEDLDKVKDDVTEQGQRLDTVEDTVQDTVAKVQEIDGKTLSHAPYWARDVSKLLNVEKDADWRLLSLRLGFTNDDIRAWAMQADPCMAMLNEWYATHKTREATHAVLTSLQLLDQEDAAAIVENAMKNAGRPTDTPHLDVGVDPVPELNEQYHLTPEAVVEDEEFEYATPPDIFLSYQWGHQDEVRLLRQHLEMAGFSCWMDVGQMGGGDKLFEKIDTGIRGAKVVISCVSTKYAKSPNCNREVNLSVNLGKPIIPLLMEKTTWPPPGSMGPIFSEYLFIRFFQRGGEETKDQRYWPLPKFQELLMQLSVNGILPDQRVVQPEYKDWWMPKVEEINIDKERAQKQSAAPSAPASGSDDKAAESPDVFISYQWGKQPQIQKLYGTLTALGYTCWLDIMQMGGGDSLYDKIDRGLRGCRVVLSCITTKYSKSANCRREVSLADAVQKPLIPLLLEKLSWPPPGPMSPILTQLLYIDCTGDNMEETWAGPKFNELLAMIDKHVPGRRQEEPAQKVPETSKQQETAASKPIPEQRSEMQAHAEPVAAPVAEKPPSPAASAPSNQEEASKEQGEKNSKGGHSPAAEPEKTDDGGGDANGKQESNKPDTYGRKTSVTSSTDSRYGHDNYNYGHQRLGAAGIQVKAMKKSACCVIQ